MDECRCFVFLSLTHTSRAQRRRPAERSPAAININKLHLFHPMSYNFQTGHRQNHYVVKQTPLPCLTHISSKSHVVYMQTENIQFFFQHPILTPFFSCLSTYILCFAYGLSFMDNLLYSVVNFF